MSNTTKIIGTLIGLALGAVILYLIGVLELLTLKASIVALVCAIAIIAAYQVHVAPFLNEDGKLISNKTVYPVENSTDENKEYTQKLVPLNVDKLVETVEDPNLIITEVDDDGIPIDRVLEIIKEKSKKPKRKPSKPRVKKTTADGK